MFHVEHMRLYIRISGMFHVEHIAVVDKCFAILFHVEQWTWRIAGLNYAFCEIAAACLEPWRGSGLKSNQSESKT